MSPADAVKITLPDGSSREYPNGVTAAEVAASIGKRLAKDAIAAKADGTWIDLDRPIEHDAAVTIVTPATPEGREVLRHSTAHVMAQAVTDLFPGARYAIGPAIADGFYYDFELPGGQTFSEDDLAKIEAEMRARRESEERARREEEERPRREEELRRRAEQEARERRETEEREALERSLREQEENAEEHAKGGEHRQTAVAEHPIRE